MLLATLLGLAVAVWAIRATGVESILRVCERLGVLGFLAYCLYSLGVFVLLGAAWLAAAGEPFARLGLFTRARLLREAAADLLPFSHIGGITLSVLLLAGRGIAQVRIYSSLAIDLLTEMASQLAFTTLGIGLLLSVPLGADASSVRPIIGIGLCLLVALGMLILLARRSGLVLARRLMERFIPASVQTLGAMGTELRRAAAPHRIGLVFLLNLAAWLASGVGAWIALQLMDIDFPLWKTLALESAIFALRSIVFAVPGGLGVQEAGYALLGPAIGLPPEATLGLALAKRVRDIVIAIPTLLMWQLFETRSLIAARNKQAVIVEASKNDSL